MTSLQRFYQCISIIQSLREIYASADFTTSFLQTAIRKARIQLNVTTQNVQSSRSDLNHSSITTSASTLNPFVSASNDPFNVLSRPNNVTSPPDSLAREIRNPTYLKSSTGVRSDTDLFASMPPRSDGSESGSTNRLNLNCASSDTVAVPDIRSEVSLKELTDRAHDAKVTQSDVDCLINFDDAEIIFLQRISSNGSTSGLMLASVPRIKPINSIRSSLVLIRCLEHFI